MTRINFQSFLFAFVVLIFAITSKTGGGDIKIPVTSDISATSLVAKSLAQPPNETGNNEKISEASKTGLKNNEDSANAKLISYLKPEDIKPISSIPKIDAYAYLAKNLDTDFIYAEKNIENRWPLASITKLMTSLVAFETQNQNLKIIISDSAVEQDGIAGNFKSGEVFSLLDMAKASLVISSNDAAYAIAENSGIKDFINLMHNKAFALNMNETSFFDPAGFSILNQSSINDLEKLVKYILKNKPEIFEITSLTEATITETNSGKARLIPTNNEFAGRPDFIGGKTGYTDEANGNLISLFTYKENTLLFVIFGSSERFNDAKKLYNWVKENY